MKPEKPVSPVMPTEPEKYIVKTYECGIYHNTLQELLDEVKEKCDPLDYNDVKIRHYGEDTSLEWFKEIPNPNYDKEMLEYEKNLLDYSNRVDEYKWMYEGLCK